MSRIAIVGLLTACLSVVAARESLAQPNQPDVLPKEYDCMKAHTYYGGKFIAGKLKCVTRCLAYFQKGITPENDCLPPYGGDTALCIEKYEIKVAAKLVDKCDVGAGADCPECYSAGCGQSQAEDAVAAFEGQVDSFVPGVFCERAGADKYEQRCQVYTGRTIAKHFHQTQKCYTRCLTDARSGGDVTTCMPPPSDGEALECFAKIEARNAAAIDRYCDGVRYPGSTPDCAGGYPSGASWTGFVRTWVDGLIAPTFCASPSKAFLD
jgi:hypothetical protein